MKFKISITLPSKDELLDGLTPEALNPKLGKARDALAAAELALTNARDEHARLEQLIKDLPARILTGHAVASEIDDALRKRDAAALMLGPYELAHAEALDLVQRQEERGKEMRDEVCRERKAILQKAIDEVTPVLEQLRTLEHALGNAWAGSATWGVYLRWPMCLADESKRHNARQAAAALPPREALPPTFHWQQQAAERQAAEATDSE